MNKWRKTVAGALVLAVLATTATPVMARDYRGHGWGGYKGHGHYGRHHRNRRLDVDAGDVIGAIAVIGVIAAIASSSKKNRDARERDDDPRREDGRYDGINSESTAVDACAQAAEDRAGRSASVRDITEVNRSSEGWDVEGVVETRDGYRDRDGETRRFNCSVRDGRVADVYIESDLALR